MPSGLFPWLDGDESVRPAAEWAFERAAPLLTGIADEFPDMRITSHPDQFCVLNSDRPDVVAASVRMLVAEARVMDAMGLPRSPWSAINIHGGKGDRLNELCDAVRDLPDPARLRLTLENDERAYGVQDLMRVWDAAGVPIVFDAHHAVVSGALPIDDPSLDDDADAARMTWASTWDLSWALAHLSNGVTGPHDRRHSDAISYVFPSLRGYSWIDVEAKGKERAIERLRASGMLPIDRSPT